MEREVKEDEETGRFVCTKLQKMMERMERLRPTSAELERAKSEVHTPRTGNTPVPPHGGDGSRPGSGAGQSGVSGTDASPQMLAVS